MIKKITILQVLFFSISALQAQDFPEAVTLEEAIEFGLENNRNIINATLEVQKAYKENGVLLLLVSLKYPPLQIIKTLLNYPLL